MINYLPPTPWRFDGHGVNDAEGQRIATLTQSLKFGPESPRLGNTLAAAPELLAALESLVELIPAADDWRTTEPIWIDTGDMRVMVALDVIAKAKGGAR